jgi:hypothetical protein
MRRRLAAAYVVTIVTVASLIFSNLLTTSSSYSTQPPVITSIYQAVTIGGPIRFDPARAYDVASGEIIQNIYEPLIFFGDKLLAPRARDSSAQLVCRRAYAKGIRVCS